jgi:hypothetical protein
MAKNSSDPGGEPEQRSDRDGLPEKPDDENKRQSGRPPTRPPYEQSPRVNRNLK